VPGDGRGCPAEEDVRDVPSGTSGIPEHHGDASRLVRRVGEPTAPTGTRPGPDGTRHTTP
jgi:hypothetical protein